jgi:hypothetical protein
MNPAVGAVLRAFPGSRLVWAELHKPPCPGCRSRAATMLRIGNPRALCTRCQPSGLSRRPRCERRTKQVVAPAAAGDLLPM